MKLSVLVMFKYTLLVARISSPKEILLLLEISRNMKMSVNDSL